MVIFIILWASPYFAGVLIYPVSFLTFNIDPYSYIDSQFWFLTRLLHQNTLIDVLVRCLMSSFPRPVRFASKVWARWRFLAEKARGFRKSMLSGLERAENGWFQPKLAIFVPKLPEDSICALDNINFRNPRAFSANKHPLAWTLPKNRTELQ